jgi:hypothetical protein
MTEKETNEPDGFDMKELEREDTLALSLITARLCANAIAMIRNGLSQDAPGVSMTIPHGPGLVPLVRMSLANALDGAARQFAQIEQEHTDASHSFEQALERFNLKGQNE